MFYGLYVHMLYYGGDLFYFLAASALQFIYGLLHFVPWGLTFLYKLRRNSTVRPPYLHSGLFRVAQPKKTPVTGPTKQAYTARPIKSLWEVFFFFNSFHGLAHCPPAIYLPFLAGVYRVF